MSIDSQELNITGGVKVSGHVKSNFGVNFGVGTDSPSDAVHVAHASPALAVQQQATSGGTVTSFGKVHADSGTLHIQSGVDGTSDSKGDIVLGSVGSATKHVVVKGATSNVGIGTDDPAYGLDVVPTARFTGNVVASNLSANAITLAELSLGVTQGLDNVVNVDNTTGNTIAMSNVTDSTSTTSGALTVAGGIGVGGNVHCSNLHASNITMNLFSFTGAQTFEQVVNTGRVLNSNVLIISNATPSTSASTGALTLTAGGLGVAGNVHVGTANLFVDTLNSRVGVGTASPGTPLHVSSSNFVSDAVGPAASANTVVRFSSTEADSTFLFGLSDTASYISSFSKTSFATERNLILNAKGGNVGIGTTGPAESLHLYKTGGVGAPGNPAPKLLFQHYPSATSAAWGDITGEVCLNYMPYHSGGERGVGIYAYRDSYASDKSASLNMYVTNDTSGIIDPALRIKGDGNVGIGTTNPTAGKLDIAVADDGTGIHIRGGDFGTNYGESHIRIGGNGLSSDNISHHAMITGGHTTSGSSYLKFSTITDYATDGNDPVERMRIDKDGKVGIQRSGPKSFLDIVGFFNFQTGSGGTYNNWEDTGINMNGDSAGGAVIFAFTMNNSNADNTGAVLYFLRKSYNSANTVWTGSSTQVQLLSGLANATSSATTLGFRADASTGTLQFRTAKQGNGHWYAIELH